LAVTSPIRVSKLPNTPTIAESGLPDFEVVGWFGIFAPAKTPQAVIDKLNQEINKILAMPDVREKLEEEGLIPGGGTPKELGTFLNNEIVKWGKLINEVGIRAN